MEVGVECIFAEDGTVRARRIRLHGRWQAVEQGRQWRDENGRHLLVMLPTGQVYELLLRPHTLTWEVQPIPAPVTAV